MAERVEPTFSVSALLGTMGPKDTTSETAPGQRCWSTGPGPRRPKGHDRLMDTVQGPADPPPAAVCPLCGSTPSAAVIRREKATLSVGDYKCAQGHIWITKWMVPA